MEGATARRRAVGVEEGGQRPRRQVQVVKATHRDGEEITVERVRRLVVADALDRRRERRHVGKGGVPACARRHVSACARPSGMGQENAHDIAELRNVTQTDAAERARELARRTRLRGMKSGESARLAVRGCGARARDVRGCSRRRGTVNGGWARRCRGERRGRSAVAEEGDDRGRPSTPWGRAVRREGLAPVDYKALRETEADPAR